MCVEGVAMHRRKFGHRTASRKGRLLNFRVSFNPWRRSKKARAQFRPGWGAMRTIRPNSASAWVWPAEQPHGLGRMQSWLSSRLGREKWKSGEFPVNAGKPLIERVKPRYIQDYRYCRRNFCRGIPRL